MKFAVVLCIFAAFYTITLAHIVLEMNPDELQRIAEILAENYLTHNLRPQPITISAQFKKVSVYALQLLGVTISLVSANILSSAILDPPSSPQMLITNNVTSIAPAQMCNRDFGCIRNVCWRACDESTGRKQNRTASWCWTTANTEARKYKQCIDHHDCSPCWECLGQCHSQKLQW